MNENAHRQSNDIHPSKPCGHGTGVHAEKLRTLLPLYKPICANPQIGKENDSIIMNRIAGKKFLGY